MRPTDLRSELRGAVYRGDSATIVAMLHGQPWPEDALQLIGDGLAAALTRHTQGAAAAAGDGVRALRDRGWDGDDELADQLDALLGTGPSPLLRALPVDLEELAGVLEGDPAFGGGRVDLLTGQVWPQTAIDEARDTGDEDEDESDDPDRWLWVHCQGSRDGYHDMVRFIDTVDDPDRADRLGIAIEGRGAFRRFKDVARWPDELDRWYGYTTTRTGKEVSSNEPSVHHRRQGRAHRPQPAQPLGRLDRSRATVMVSDHGAGSRTCTTAPPRAGLHRWRSPSAAASPPAHRRLVHDEPERPGRSPAASLSSSGGR